MNIRTIILDELTELFEEDDLTVPEFTDDTLLLETELDSLGFASTKAEDSEAATRDGPGWDGIPSSAPASHPLPRNP